MQLLNKLKKIDPYSRHFLIASVIILLTLIIFYPSFYTTTDEREYIENAYLIGQGDLVRQNQQCYDGAYCGYFNGTGYVSKYNLGLSFILLPAVLINWRITFLISVLAFIIGLYIFRKLLEKYKFRAKFIYIYAFFPTFVYYSHKVMTEVYTLTLIMILYYLLFEKEEGTSKFNQWIYKFRYPISGLVAGAIVLIKYSNLIAVVPILLYWMFITIKERGVKLDLKKGISKLIKPSIGLTLAAIPLLLLFLWINNTQYGSPFRSGYYFSKEEFLIIPSLIIPQFLKYAAILLLIYPGLLLSAFFSKFKHKYLVILLIVIYLIFYAGFPGYSFDSGILDFIFAPRFFIPILGLVLFCFVEVTNRVLNRFRNESLLSIIILIIVVLLIANSVAMNYIFKGRLDELAKQSTEIYKIVPNGGNFTGDIEQRKLVNEAFGKGERWLFINGQ